MSSIKSLADELRETIKFQESGTSGTSPEKDSKGSKQEKSTELTKKKNHIKPTEELIINFFAEVDKFQLTGTEKLLIRLDTRTTNLLKQLKLAKGIEMNKFIAYGLQKFLDQNPWLALHIKETLKNTEL